MRPVLYKLLLVFTVLCSIGGILTLWPFSGASYPNIIGYSSLCTFTPAASLFCFLMAGISCMIRAAFAREASGSAKERITRHRAAFFPLGFLLIAALICTVWFGVIKGRYTGVDAASSSSQVSID